MTSDLTTVVLIDDHGLIREGLRRAFERDGGFAVVGEGSTCASALELLTEHQPKVLITDVRLPDGSGLDIVRTARKVSATLGIVVLTMHAGDDQLFEALEAGASAFVPKSAPSDDVVAAARHAASSPTAFVAPDLAAAMQRRMNPTGPTLTAREREVLDLLADGLGISAISKKLFISESTTKTHVAKLYDKLGAANRAQALMAALKAGLIAPR